MSEREYATDVKIEDVMKTPLKETGFEIPNGSYAGILVGFSEAFRLPIAEKYLKGRPTGSKRLVFDAEFAIRVKNSAGEMILVKVTNLLPVPDGGAANKKSNLYRMLKSMKGGDAAFFKQDAAGGFSEGVTLSKFVGCACTVQTELNKEGFANVEAVAGPVDGLNYPTLEEARKSLQDDTSPF